MMFGEFLFLCGLCITLGLCIVFGGLLGFGFYVWVREIFIAGGKTK